MRGGGAGRRPAKICAAAPAQGAAEAYGVAGTDARAARWMASRVAVMFGGGVTGGWIPGSTHSCGRRREIGGGAPSCWGYAARGAGESCGSRREIRRVLAERGAKMLAAASLAALSPPTLDAKRVLLSEIGASKPAAQPGPRRLPRRRRRARGEAAASPLLLLGGGRSYTRRRSPPTRTAPRRARCRRSATRRTESSSNLRQRSRARSKGGGAGVRNEQMVDEAAAQSSTACACRLANRSWRWW